MKQCFSCGKTNRCLISIRIPGMADDHLGKCKICARRDVTANRLAKLEKVRAYDRARADRPEAKASRRQVALIWQIDQEKIATVRQRNRKYEKENPLRVRAKNAVRRAVAAGKLIKATFCERCHLEKVLHAHHEDYLELLKVSWLCASCHGLRHREINEARRTLGLGGDTR